MKSQFLGSTELVGYVHEQEKNKILQRKIEVKKQEMEMSRQMVKSKEQQLKVEEEQKFVQQQLEAFQQKVKLIQELQKQKNELLLNWGQAQQDATQLEEKKIYEKFQKQQQLDQYEKLAKDRFQEAQQWSSKQQQLNPYTQAKQAAEKRAETSSQFQQRELQSLQLYKESRSHLPQTTEQEDIEQYYQYYDKLLHKKPVQKQINYANSYFHNPLIEKHTDHIQESADSLAEYERKKLNQTKKEKVEKQIKDEVETNKRGKTAIEKLQLEQKEQKLQKIIQEEKLAIQLENIEKEKQKAFSEQKEIHRTIQEQTKKWQNDKHERIKSFDQKVRQLNLTQKQKRQESQEKQESLVQNSSKKSNQNKSQTRAESQDDKENINQNKKQIKAEGEQEVKISAQRDPIMDFYRQQQQEEVGVTPERVEGEEEQQPYTFQRENLSNQKKNEDENLRQPHKYNSRTNSNEQQFLEKQSQQLQQRKVIQSQSQSQNIIPTSSNPQNLYDDYRQSYQKNQIKQEIPNLNQNQSDSESEGGQAYEEINNRNISYENNNFQIRRGLDQSQQSSSTNTDIESAQDQIRKYIQEQEKYLNELNLQNKNNREVIQQRTRQVFQDNLRDLSPTSSEGQYKKEQQIQGQSDVEVQEQEDDDINFYYNKKKEDQIYQSEILQKFLNPKLQSQQQLQQFGRRQEQDLNEQYQESVQPKTNSKKFRIESVNQNSELELEDSLNNNLQRSKEKSGKKQKVRWSSVKKNNHDDRDSELSYSQSDLDYKEIRSQKKEQKAYFQQKEVDINGQGGVQFDVNFGGEEISQELLEKRQKVLRKLQQSHKEQQQQSNVYQEKQIDKQKLYELRKQMMKKPQKIHEKPQNSSSTKMEQEQQPPQSIPQDQGGKKLNYELMERLARGEKKKLTKDEYQKLSSKNYEKLPEVLKKKDQEEKEAQKKLKQVKIKEYDQELRQSRKFQK